ncbi:MAG: glutathione S-transferase family protein [Xenophilus sp.]
MSALKLYIGNKNYSSWSMRPWVLMKQAGIPFEEVMVRFDSFGADSRFKAVATAVNPSGTVPVLLDGELAVWDTLAIAEYLAERFPGRRLWPGDAAARARARSICAEMHAGFTALRGHCGMNIEADLREVGRRVLAEQAGVRGDLERIGSMWSELLAAHGGPMLFGDFCIADAYYAPVASRIRTYGLPVPPEAQAYADRLLALPGAQAWIAEALAEHDFVPFDEPYRSHR